MSRYIAKRIVWGAITLLLFVTALFFLINLLVPGDFMTQFRLGLDAEQRAAMAAELGLDRSLWSQYLDWMGGVLQGDLGNAFAGPPVAQLVFGALATSVLLFSVGVLIAFPIGNFIGRVAAWRRNGFLVGSTTLVAVVAFTAFPPALAFALQRGIANATSPQAYLSLTRLRDGEWRQANLFGVIPGGDDAIPEPTDVLWQMVIVAFVALALVVLAGYLLRRFRRMRIPAPVRVAAVIGLTAAGWILLGIGWRSLDLLGVMLLPIVGVVILYYGEIQLVTDAAMEEALDADYVTTARAKGLEERHIRDRHAARAAILPVLSRLVVSIPYFLAGLAILEEVFGVPGGLGNLLFRAIRNQDTSVVVGTLVVVGLFSLIARLVMDVLYAVLDPRIRYGSGRLEVESG